MSLWGLSEGIAAIVGLNSTSESPAATEKISVPINIPQNSWLLNKKGESAKRNNPVAVIRGMIFTIIFGLNFFEKKVKTKSMPSCVMKLTSTSVPKSVHEIP